MNKKLIQPQKPCKSVETVCPSAALSKSSESWHSACVNVFSVDHHGETEASMGEKWEKPQRSRI